MSRIYKGYYLWWNNLEFFHLDQWNDVIAREGAYVAAVKSTGRTVYGVIKGHQYISINKVDVPKELLAGMLVLGVPT
jgi:hypothetical protein